MGALMNKLFEMSKEARARGRGRAMDCVIAMHPTVWDALKTEVPMHVSTEVTVNALWGIPLIINEAVPPGSPFLMTMELATYLTKGPWDPSVVFRRERPPAKLI